MDAKQLPWQLLDRKSASCWSDFIRDLFNLKMPSVQGLIKEQHIAISSFCSLSPPHLHFASLLPFGVQGGRRRRTEDLRNAALQQWPTAKPWLLPTSGFLVLLHQRIGKDVSQAFSESSRHFMDSQNLSRPSWFSIYNADCFLEFWGTAFPHWPSLWFIYLCID